MTFLDEIKARLVAQGITAGSVFLSSKAEIPTGAGPYYLIRETGGSGPSTIQTGISYQRPSAQLVGLASTYPVAHAAARAMYDALVNVVNQSLSGTSYLRIIPLNEPGDTLGLDPTGRAQCAFNVTAKKRPS